MTVRVLEMINVCDVSKERVCHYIKSRFRPEKTVFALGVAFANVRPKTRLNENLLYSVGVA